MAPCLRHDSDELHELGLPSQGRLLLKDTCCDMITVYLSRRHICRAESCINITIKTWLKPKSASKGRTRSLQ
ncbi:hypothetical protein DPMN_177835 [Dreissena polymorpha]|uniref:Uncharacterized protein n=1 Tax=Dreissena polymorpha TaxID=45954 RepID=A0A9D4E9Q8_DREPO|nr:hypothetical protein DPMN_177835 [Dreissena polymorpha]